MRVIELADTGGGTQLKWSSRPRPACGPADVLIEVRAAGLNHADLAQRAGRYRLQPGMSDIMGLEVSGVVAQVGNDVRSFAVGDEVCALLSGGGYAEFACVPAVQCLPIPKGLDFAQAAVLPEAFATVWLNVFQKASLLPGETLLVHGGSSGVGIAAIQLASALGSSVIATAGTDEKCGACVEEGARLAVNYKEQDFEDVISGSTPSRVDVILDMVGGSYFGKNLNVLARDGRMVYIAALGGKAVELDLVTLMRKRLTLFGSVLRPLDPKAKGQVLSAMSAIAWPLLERRAIVPRIHARYGFDDVEKAHEVMLAHGHIGKLVIELG